jgi:chemotaxis protein methyltransferase CheR
MNKAFDLIADLIHRESGVRVPRDRRSSTIARALATATPDRDAESFLHGVAGDRDSLARLLDVITIKETFFHRDERQLRSIDWHALAEGARNRGSGALEVWAAGCATGEEPYTLALLALEAFGNVDPPVRILGTDISRTAIGDAERGEYRERSLRLVPSWQRTMHFEPSAGATTRIGERARRLVRLEQHNIVRDPIPAPGVGGFDVVLCRNVLIYFDAPTVAIVVDRLRESLRPDGTLVLGAADTLCLTASTLGRLDRRTTVALPSHRPPRRANAVRGSAPAVAPAPSDAAPDATSHFLHGLVALQRGDAEAAVTALRRALYLEPRLAAASFQLGRGHEATGDRQAAVRAYEQTLRTIAEHPEGDLLLEQIDPSDIASACRHRIEALA